MISNVIGKLKDNIVYLVVVVVASFLAVKEYGYEVVFKSLLILFCMFVPILNAIGLYGCLKNGLQTVSKGQILYLVISTIFFFLIFFFGLSPKFQTFVLIFSSIIIVCLLVVYLFKVGFKGKGY